MKMYMDCPITSGGHKNVYFVQ